MRNVLLVSPVDPFESTGTPGITHYSELYLRDYCERLRVFNYRKSTFPSKFHLAKFLVPGFASWDRRRMNEKLIHLVEGEHYDLILIFKGEDLFPETIKKMKKSSNGLIASWMADSPFSFEYVEKSLRYYDYYFIWDSWYLGHLKRAGVRNPVHLPPYTIPEVFKRVALPESEMRRFGADLVFVGTWRPDRERVLKQLLHFDLRIFGNGWIENSRLSSKYLNPEVSISEINKIYNASKIVINIHHEWGKNDANFRTFEALSSGAFLIDERKKDILSLFKEDEEIVLYEGIGELKTKIEYFLDHDEERRRIAERGSGVVHREHTLTARYEKLFESIDTH
jgi:spore maturation protein CgeB